MGLRAAVGSFSVFFGARGMRFLVHFLAVMLLQSNITVGPIFRRRFVASEAAGKPRRIGLSQAASNVPADRYSARAQRPFQMGMGNVLQSAITAPDRSIAGQRQRPENPRVRP